MTLRAPPNSRILRFLRSQDKNGSRGLGKGLGSLSWGGGRCLQASCTKRGCLDGCKGPLLCHSSGVSSPFFFSLFVSSPSLGCVFGWTQGQGGSCFFPCPGPTPPPVPASSLCLFARQPSRGAWGQARPGPVQVQPCVPASQPASRPAVWCLLSRPVP